MSNLTAATGHRVVVSGIWKTGLAWNSSNGRCLHQQNLSVTLAKQSERWRNVWHGAYVI